MVRTGQANALHQPLDQLELAGRFVFEGIRGQEARGFGSILAEGISATSLIMFPEGRFSLTPPPTLSASARATYSPSIALLADCRSPRARIQRREFLDRSARPSSSTSIAIPLLIGTRAQTNLPAFDSCDRVGDHVARDTFEMTRIEVAARHFAIIDCKIESLVDRLRARSSKPHRRRFDWGPAAGAAETLPAADLIQVEHVADREIHRPRGGADSREDVLAILFAQVLVIEQIDEAGDRGDRAADIVRHRRDLSFAKCRRLIQLIDLRVEPSR